MRSDFTLGKLPHTLAQVLLFVRKAEFHVFSGETMRSRNTQPKYNLYHTTCFPSFAWLPNVLVSPTAFS
jgi:hypothetical protein